MSGDRRHALGQQQVAHVHHPLRREVDDQVRVGVQAGPRDELDLRASGPPRVRRGQRASGPPLQRFGLPGRRKARMAGSERRGRDHGLRRRRDRVAGHVVAVRVRADDALDAGRRPSGDEPLQFGNRARREPRVDHHCAVAAREDDDVVHHAPGKRDPADRRRHLHDVEPERREPRALRLQPRDKLGLAGLVRHVQRRARVPGHGIRVRGLSRPGNSAVPRWP